MNQTLNDTISRSVLTRHWQKLCLRYATGSDGDRRRINDVLGAGDRLHFELAWAATYGATKQIPQPPPRRIWWPRWPRAWRLKALLAELEAAGQDSLQDSSQHSLQHSLKAPQHRPDRGGVEAGQAQG